VVVRDERRRLGSVSYYVCALLVFIAHHQSRLAKIYFSHIAVIPPSIRRTPGTVPTEPFGIGNEDFNAGHKESKYGYPVLELYELVHPVTLEEMKSRWGLGGAPMGWRYIGADLWGDRWGDGEDRAEKATRVF
jgi:hypothetical protein